MNTGEEFNLEVSEMGFELRFVSPEITTYGTIGLFRGEIKIDGEWISTVWNPDGDNRYSGDWNLKSIESSID